MCFTSSREDTQELTIRLEWLCRFEGDIERSDIFEILSEWSIVIWVIPIPSWYTLIIVFEYPTKSFNVRPSDSDISCAEVGTYSLMNSLSVIWTPNFCS